MSKPEGDPRQLGYLLQSKTVVIGRQIDERLGPFLAPFFLTDPQRIAEAQEEFRLVCPNACLTQADPSRRSQLFGNTIIMEMFTAFNGVGATLAALWSTNEVVDRWNETTKLLFILKACGREEKIIEDARRLGVLRKKSPAYPDGIVPDLHIPETADPENIRRLKTAVEHELELLHPKPNTLTEARFYPIVPVSNQ